MADLILPDPRFEMPELFEPGVKPFGDVIIDRSHWSGEHTNFAYIATDATNLANKNESLTYINNTFTTVYKGEQVAAVNYYGNQDDYILSAKPYLPSSGDWTLTLKIHKKFNTTSEYIFGQYAASQAGRSLLRYMSYGSGLYYYNGSFVNTFTFASGSVPYGESVTINLRRKGNQWDMFLNGEKATVTITNSQSTYQVETAFFGANGGIGDQLRGFGSLAKIDTIAFSDEQIQSLHKNPYRFLIPA